MFISILLLAAAQVEPPSPAPEATTSEASSRLRQAVGAILRADGEETARILAEVSETELDADDRRFRACVASRLVTPEPAVAVQDTMTRDLLSRYRSYWTAAMAGGQDRDRLEESLRRDLLQMLELRPDATWEAVETSIGERLGEVGLHSRLGRTGHMADVGYMLIATDHPHYVDWETYSADTADFDFRHGRRYAAGTMMTYRTPGSSLRPIRLDNDYEFVWAGGSNRLRYLLLRVETRAAV